MGAPTGERTITGLATTADQDRHGDVVEPDGMVADLPVPLLWQHDHKYPIGRVVSAVRVPEGIRITAHLVEGEETADRVWKLISQGAIDGFSIGFIPLDGVPLRGSDGMRWTSWELLEVSAVAVPSNRGSKIGKAGSGSVKLLNLSDHPGAVKLLKGAKR